VALSARAGPEADPQQLHRQELRSEYGVRTSRPELLYRVSDSVRMNSRRALRDVVLHKTARTLVRLVDAVTYRCRSRLDAIYPFLRRKYRCKS